MPNSMINQIMTVVTEGLNYQTWQDPSGKHHIKGGSLGEKEIIGVRIECRERDRLCLYNEKGERIFQSSWPVKETILLGKRAE